MCKMIQFTEVFCFQVVTSIKFFNLGLDVRWLLPLAWKLAIGRANRVEGCYFSKKAVK